MKIKNLFLLSWKKLWIIVVGGFASIILHNLISGLMGTEEVFFFMLVVFALPAYILIAGIYSLIYKIKDKNEKTL
ncbi:MAG: hypothetical protein ABIG40_03445 [Parcubacteria group bacterium]